HPHPPPDTAPLSLHDALPISDNAAWGSRRGGELPAALARREDRVARIETAMRRLAAQAKADAEAERQRRAAAAAARHRTGQTRRDRKSTRLNSSHVAISYAVF